LRHNAPYDHAGIGITIWRIPINCQSIGNARIITFDNRTLSHPTALG